MRNFISSVRHRLAGLAARRRRHSVSMLVGLAAVALFACACTHHESAHDEHAASADVGHETSGDAPHEASEAERAAAEAEQSALLKEDPMGVYGAGVVLEERTSIDDILADPEPYEGRIVQVAGPVVEVCPKRGCWMDLAAEDRSKRLRIKVTDGDIVFPLSATGSPAVVEGIVEKIELNEEQHRAWKAHEAEERGEEFDPASVSGAAAIWRISGLGAKIDR